jgi:hypothetical protein
MKPGRSYYTLETKAKTIRSGTRIKRPRKLMTNKNPIISLNIKHITIRGLAGRRTGLICALGSFFFHERCRRSLPTDISTHGVYQPGSFQRHRWCVKLTIYFRAREILHKFTKMFKSHTSMRLFESWNTNEFQS